MRTNMLAVSLEEEDLPDDGTVVTASEVADTATQLQESEQNIDSADQEIKTAMEAVRSLECLCESLGQSQEVTPQVAAVTEVALESIYQSIGVNRPRVLTFEADDTSSESRIAKIKQQIRRIMLAIAEAFRRALDWVTDYLLQVTSAAARLERYAIAQQRELRKLRGNKPKATQFKNATLARKLYCEDADLPKTMLRVQELVNDSGAAALGDHVKLLNRAIDDFAAGKDIAALMERVPEVMQKAFGGIFQNEGKDVPVDLEEQFHPEGTNVLSTDWLVGGYIGLMVLPEDVSNIGKLAFYIRRAPEIKSGDVMDYASFDEADQLLRQCIDICKLVRSFEKNRKGLEDFYGKLTSTTRKLNSVEGDFSEQDRVFLKSLMAVAPMIAKGIHHRVFGYAVNTVRSVVQYTDLSMTNLQEDK